MISRRLVRIKTLQALYAWQQNNGETTVQGRNELRDAMLRSYDMYIFMLELPQALNQFLLSERDHEASKYFPDKEKIRNYRIFENNRVSVLLYDKVSLFKRKLFTTTWNEFGEQFNTILEELRQQEFAIDYLVFDTHTLAQQKDFFDQFYTWLFDHYEFFNQLMEEVYPAWNDDDTLLLREIKKTLGSITEDGFVRLDSPISQEDEDLQYGLKMYDVTCYESENYETRIADITDNWDPARIAVIDLICIKMALTEFLAFHEIPVKVTINEYLDIIKNYSTPNSSRFINGILDKLRIQLEKTGNISKSGRGLRDN